MKHVPARKVITRSTCRTIGKYFSWKMHQMVHWESQLERDFIFLLDASPNIAQFYEQPFTLNLGNSLGKYTPDFLIISTQQKKTIVEVKPSEKVATFIASDKIVCVKEHCAQENIKFVTFDETTIRQNPRLENAKHLLRFRNHKSDKAIRTAIRRYLSRVPRGSISELIATIDAPRTYKELMTMILEGDICFPQDQLLENCTSIFLREEQHETILIWN